MLAFRGSYNINTLINLVSLLPDGVDENSTYHLLGEFKDDSGKVLLSPELKSLENFVYEKYMSIYYILKGGGHLNELGSTPKKRLIQALQNLRQKWMNQQEVSAPWDEFVHKKWGSC